MNLRERDNQRQQRGEDTRRADVFHHVFQTFRAALQDDDAQREHVDVKNHHVDGHIENVFLAVDALDQRQAHEA